VTDIEKLVADVERARGKYLRTVRGLSPEQAEFKPSPDVWSIRDITEHLVHAEQGGVALIWAAADGIRRGQPVWEGDPPHRGRAFEEIVERTWRVKEEAPESARPVRGGPLAYWAEGLRVSKAMLKALARELDGLDLSRVIYPHFLSGPLDARQRLQFLRFHIDRHRAQVESLLARSDFPGDRAGKGSA